MPTTTTTIDPQQPPARVDERGIRRGPAVPIGMLSMGWWLVDESGS